MSELTHNGLRAEVSRLGRRVAELEAEKAAAVQAMAEARRKAMDAQGARDVDVVIGLELRAERDAAQRDAATLRGALEGLRTTLHEECQLPRDTTTYGVGVIDGLRVAIRHLDAALAPAPAQATSEEGKSDG